MDCSIDRVTGADLYDFCKCEHRVHLDRRGPIHARDEFDAFAKLLWERGLMHEHEVVGALEGEIVDLSVLSGIEKEQATRDAIRAAAQLIYAGRISHGDLLGEPDLLRRKDAAYIAGDIKSGNALDVDRKAPRFDYAMQLALYTDILEREGLSDGKRACFVIDGTGEEIPYDLNAPLFSREPRTLWDAYQEHLEDLRRVIAGRAQSSPALSAVCKQCHWRTYCDRELRARDDLTLIAELGRTTRSALATSFPTVSTLADADIESLITGPKTQYKGIGADSLRRFHLRARLLSNPALGASTKIAMQPKRSDTEIFFDIEDDPLKGHCYLHGFLVCTDDTDEYFGLYADMPDADGERKAFRDAWDLIRALPGDAPIYYYSPHERTWWRHLSNLYPDICSAEEVENLFELRAVDLYTEFVRKNTDWPTNDYSIKTLAKYLGFHWRDENPSGAASIAWYSEWIKGRDPKVKSRILEYNEDDCRATKILLEGLRGLPVRP